jgi:hypothetical protein
MSPRPTRHRLECPSCGAPLRWKGEAPVVACRYCDTHVHTPSGQVTQQPAVVRSQGKASGGGCIVAAAILGVNLLAGGIALIAQVVSSGIGSVSGVPFEELASISLEADNATIAAALGLKPDEEGDDLHIPLRGSDFDFAWLRWEEAHPEHVASFGFHVSDGHPDPAALTAALEGSLGRRLAPTESSSRHWRWAGSSLHVAEDGSHLGGNSDPEDDPHWAYRTRLLWTVALAAAQGAPLQVQPETRKAWLAHGYRLGELVALDLRTDVDRAVAVMQSGFPGSHAVPFISLDIEVPLDHAWFGEAELSWANEPGGPLEALSLGPAPGHPTFPDQAAIRACLDRALGTGEYRVDDHLEGTWSVNWAFRDGSWAHLSQYALNLHAGHDDRLGQAGWRPLLTALEACDPR